jgi:Asp-tRNA(Asn)/Glu-tRNA(Gln) amidotransferase C subunit
MNLTESQLKQVIKLAILEIFQEQRETISEIFTEALEDMAMSQAIEEGKETEPVSRDRIFQILKDNED